MISGVNIGMNEGIIDGVNEGVTVFVDVGAAVTVSVCCSVGILELHAARIRKKCQSQSTKHCHNK